MEMDNAVLVVEDDDRVRSILEAVLERAGYQVTVLADGAEALHELVPEHPDTPSRFCVVVSDIQLGDVSGLDILGAARTLPSPPEVILLTGHASLDTAITALRAGAFDYLLKPFSSNELIACVGRAAEQHAANFRQVEAIRTITQIVDQLQVPTPPLPDPRDPQSERFVRVGALVLDRHRHAATFADQPIRLTPIEFELLLYLGEMQGHVLGYADIVRRTHGTMVEKAEAQSILKVYIHSLRRKIDPAYLVNVRGAGYMLVEPE